MALEPADEPARIAELKGYGVLDTPNEAEFDAIVREAAAALGVPIALISLIDENRQWFKARVGLEPRETPRSISFCTHAIRGPDVFVVNDAKSDPRFSENPLVTGDPNIRFYAGAPLRTPSGRRIGTLCVIDSTARPQLTERDTARLALLAEKTMEALERRRQRLASSNPA
ncbi:GAF domain-containing protein [Sphingomonas pokkalii]|uniref:Diguanylate cyclase n=1 Tax=Sphingomonas pokkalii TaxID=2175090 RepID=A0A2U0S9L6_9SPHN|nr:GAF domain-containing protein [Sphingomonas pokkalii]PVX28067.1 diguanylate cyclase [Sphingomonas pokkalii]